MNKIFRMGHRTPKNGVITIASQIKDDQIFYGVSYCSPKEPKYLKHEGISMASARLEQNAFNNVSIPLSELKHSAVVIDIITDILKAKSHPYWAETLLIENLMYPVGLARFGKNKQEPKINAIMVDSEYSKDQLIRALDYIHSLWEIDTEFMAVNKLVHIDQSAIMVQSDEPV